MLNYDYTDNKKIETIVLLHGFGGNSNCFKKQIKELTSFFNIVTIDMHGHGKSKNLHLNAVNNFDLRKIAFDINVILEKLHLHKVHIMGLSLGTMVANAYAYHYPYKVLSLLNIAAITKLKPSNHFSLNLAYKLRRFIPHMLVYYTAGLIIMPLRKHQKARKIFIKEAKKMHHDDFFAWTKIMMSFETSYPSEKLDFSFPTLYISGAYDHIFVDNVEKHCTLCENSYLHILKNAGHICNIDDPEYFNKVMSKFYKDLLFKPLIVNSVI